VTRLRELEGANVKLKRINGPAKRQIPKGPVREHQLPVHRACSVGRLSPMEYDEPPVPSSRRDAEVIAALMDAGRTVIDEGNRGKGWRSQ
jgi:hypothetical protein